MTENITALSIQTVWDLDKWQVTQIPQTPRAKKLTCRSQPRGCSMPWCVRQLALCGWLSLTGQTEVSVERTSRKMFDSYNMYDDHVKQNRLLIIYCNNLLALVKLNIISDLLITFIRKCRVPTSLKILENIGLENALNLIFSGISWPWQRKNSDRWKEEIWI